MIKGVNRQVVEINDTGSVYFERALFFVKPEYAGLGEARLREKARKAAGLSSRPPDKKPPAADRLKRALQLAAAGISGAVAAGIIFSLL